MKIAALAFIGLTIFAIPAVVSGAKANGRAKKSFNCDDGCDLDEKVNGPPVCGDDGITYFNECLAVCQEGVTVVRPGNCGGSKPINANDKTYVRQGKVSKEKLDKFKESKFKYVAKRNFSDLPFEEPTFDPNESFPEPSSLKAVRITADGDEYVSNEPEAPEMTDDGAIHNAFPGTSADETVDNEDASGGGLRRQLAVHNENDRFRISPTTSYPNRIIGQVNFKKSNGSGYTCSGTVVSRTSVLTNGHCVWNKDARTWNAVTGFSPGRDGSYNPFGTWSIDYMTTYTAYTNDNNIDYDFAVLTLTPNGSNSLIGDTVGYAGYAWTERTNSALQNAVVIGYPGDKPSGTMWHSGSCYGTYTPWNGYTYNVLSKCNTYKGSSGAALLDLTGQWPTVRGVNWGEFTDGSYTLGLALHSSHYWSLRSWSNRGSEGFVQVTYDFNKCMDLASNTNIYMFDCHYGSNQKFYLDHSTKQIKTPSKPGYCLDYNFSNGNVYMHPCHGGSNQRWRYNSSNQFLQSEYNDHCLDYNFSNGNLYMFGCHGGSNQKFVFPEDFW